MSEQTTEQKTKFSIKIDQPSLKQMLESINSLTEECIIKLDNEGLSCTLLDPSHVAMINVRYPNMMFEQYEVFNEGIIGFKLEDALKIINDIPKESSIKILNDNDDLLLIANGTNYYLTLDKDPFKNDQPIPKIPFDSTFESYEFTKYVKRLIKFGEYVNIECSNHTVKLDGYNHDAKTLISIRLEKGHPDLVNIGSKSDLSTCNYSLQHLITYLKTIPLGTLQKIEFSSMKPLRHRVIVTNVGTIDFYLAPRVEN